MKTQILGLRVASILFGLMSVAQLTRIIINPEILVAGYPLPLWPSAIAVAILGCLCIWLYQLSRLRPSEPGSKDLLR